jgi:hypothetical protein
MYWSNKKALSFRTPQARGTCFQLHKMNSKYFRQHATQ